MTDFLKTIEILIDQVILHLPSEWFVEAPFLAVLLSNPNGRYVLTGILIVAVFIFLWVILLSFQVMFGSRLRKSKQTVLQNADEQNKLATSAGPDGFKFFKRKGTLGSVADNEMALREIEKEMRMVRKQYVDGHMLQDVYVAETRRLYNIAKPLKP
ncbi:hypothetical protein OBB02_00440 [Candidatus Puniceispirillum sp.]|nr:hypothetical protein [Candidatus Puniceispirillum sp.]